MKNTYTRTRTPRAERKDSALILQLEFKREIDGRWIAVIPQMPGVMQYGRTKAEAFRNVQALAMEVLAAELKHGERDLPTNIRFR